ncbi:hypothetical protein L9F63_022036 [Diploptera punctata]|uniref:Uncharacterized protein n=1 Tax=Diploptera punctata TaxID=6984 RepID=A0AAD7ZMR5_DIPPU|nr:hypothetical protein L9F63_022036 [Diploptera punctata]
MSDGESFTFNEHCLTPPDLTSPDIIHPLTTSSVTRLSPADQQQRVPSLDNRRQILNPSDLSRRTIGSSQLLSHSHKCILPSCQNVLPPSDIRTSLPASSDLCISTSSQNLQSTNLGDHCLLTPTMEQTNPANSSASLCITTPVIGRTCLQPHELNQHCLEFEETPSSDPSDLLVFDDESLESPDLDHLLIS